MRRLAAVLLPLTAFVSTTEPVAAIQSRARLDTPSTNPATQVCAPSAASCIALLDAVSDGKTMPADQRRDAAWHSRLLTAIGGAALGAGVGFFTSQVVRGDWEEERGRNEVDRSAWAAVAGSIGFAVGFTFPLGGRPAEPGAVSGLPGGRKAIDAGEIEGRGLSNAYDAVQLLRPEWLNERGVHVIGEVPEETTEVYLDDVRLGGTSSLREVGVHIIRSMHYFDAAAATLRWGSGHSHGVILIIARGGR